MEDYTLELEKFLGMLKPEVDIRMGTSDGSGWIYLGTVGEFNLPNFLSRPMSNVYWALGREGNQNCCPLEPALCLVVDGDERGRY